MQTKEKIEAARVLFGYPKDSVHVPIQCQIAGCKEEASYWVDTEGFSEVLMANGGDDTFYMCVDHMNAIEGSEGEEGIYKHLRIDTGEVYEKEIASYACADDCDVCNM